MHQISESEWQVMRVIWAKGKATSSDIITVLGESRQWSDSTIKTLLGRLVEKGVISSQKQGRAFLYQAEISEEHAHNDELKSVLDRICVTEHCGLLARVIERTPMTLKDIATFQELLLAKKETAVDRIICDCVPGQCRCAKHKEERYG